MPSTCPSEQDLRAFQLGQLSDETLDAVAQHLEICLRCETLAQRLDTVIDPMLAAIRCPSASSPVLTRRFEAPSATPEPGSARGSTVAAGYPTLRPAEQDDEIGRLGNYRVLRPLGKGGMAYVFQAEDIALRRSVALKVMRQDLNGEAEGGQRFLREARIMASIKHENLVTVFQAGEDGSAVYLAMELLHGQTLEQRLEGAGPAALDEIMRLAKAIAKGLAVVHGHGLVHRDIKPGNIWLEAPSGRVKILDFGLARFVRDDVTLTVPGTIMGTPAFMAPEQASGAAVDVRSDLFSLGCVLYWASTGVKAFDARDMMAILSQLALRTPCPVHELNPALPIELSDLVAQLLKKNPDERPPSAEAVLECLQQMEAEWNATSPWARVVRAAAVRLPTAKHSRLSKVFVIVLMLGLLAAALWAFFAQHGGPVPPPTPVYLSSLAIVDAVNWPFDGKLPGPPPRPEPADWPPAQGGQRVFIRGKPSLHGIWMHLPPVSPKEVRITYALDKQYRNFNTEVSLNDGPRECNPMTFAVYGDGRLLWQSKPVSSQANTQSCANLSVRGVDIFTLVVSGRGDSKGTHAVWVEPCLTK